MKLNVPALESKSITCQVPYYFNIVFFSLMTYIAMFLHLTLPKLVCDQSSGLVSVVLLKNIQTIFQLHAVLFFKFKP